MRPETTTRIIINLDYLLHNYDQVVRHVSPSKVVAVVKSEAYGHGAVPVAQTLQAHGCWAFAVAHVDEGIQLRHADIKGEIMVMGATFPSQYQAMAEYELTPILPDVKRMEAWATVAQGTGQRLPYHIKVDVGLGRMGFMPHQGSQAMASAKNLLSSIDLQGISSHLSFPTGSLEHNETEYQRYLEFISPFEDTFPHITKHLSASQAAERFKHMHLDLVRIGGLLYGIQHVTDSPLQLKPVLSYKTTLAQVKELPPGWCIGYNLSHEVKEPTRVGLLPLGWTDGLSSFQHGKAEFLVRGHRCKLLGTCTDFSMIDLAQAPDVTVGDEVILIGEQRGETITAIQLGKSGGTSTGQLLGKISLRIPRIYHLQGAEQSELSILNYR